jgi:hypothetical protein
MSVSLYACSIFSNSFLRLRSGVGLFAIVNAHKQDGKWPRCIIEDYRHHPHPCPGCGPSRKLVARHSFSLLMHSFWSHSPVAQHPPFPSAVSPPPLFLWVLLRWVNPKHRNGTLDRGLDTKHDVFVILRTIELLLLRPYFILIQTSFFRKNQRYRNSSLLFPYF